VTKDDRHCRGCAPIAATALAVRGRARYAAGGGGGGFGGFGGGGFGGLGGSMRTNPFPVMAARAAASDLTILHRRGVLRYRVRTHDAANDDAIGQHVPVTTSSL
jgi:hypothetical protein